MPGGDTMWRGRFWCEVAERMVKTAAQSAVALLTADGVLGLLDVDWGQGASVVGLASLMSLLTSIGSAPIGPPGTPGITR